jgi:hypothetical protein
MVTTVTEAFRVFKSNLQITDLQEETISTRQKDVRAAVEEELVVLDSFLTGSYSRYTMIAPLVEADIDIFVVLNSTHFEQNGQVNLLDKVKRVLKKTYPKTPEVSRDGQAVTITFKDFKVDVVPGFNRSGGGYLIPSTYGGGFWISTDPKKHVEISSQENANHDGDLVPLIKMIKRWNRIIDWQFRSFHLEVLAWKIFTGVKISDYPSGVRYFFDKGKNLIGTSISDPSGYSGNVGYYIDSQPKVSEAVLRFTTAYTRAINAEAYASQNKIEDAINEWRKIFGDKFPVYG